MNLFWILKAELIYVNAKVRPCKPNIYRGGASEAGSQVHFVLWKEKCSFLIKELPA